MGYNRIETSKFLYSLILEEFFSITFITRAVFYLENRYSIHIAVLPFVKIRTVDLQCLEHILDYENLFEIGIVRANEG